MSRPPVLTCAAAGCSRQFRVPVADLDERGCSEHRGAVVVDPAPVVFEPLPFAEELGACVGLPAGCFDGDDLDDAAAAVRVCAGCPVLVDCHGYAARTAVWGVWGGALWRGGLEVALPAPVDEPLDDALDDVA